MQICSDDVVSSHWKHHLKDMTGFGAFREDNVKNRVRYFIELKLAETLLKKYRCPPCFILIGKQIAKKSNRLFDFDCIKQVLSLTSIMENYPGVLRSICIVGDGYGYFASLIRAISPTSFILCINIKEVLEIDKKYYEMVNEADQKIQFIDAKNYAEIQNYKIDLFVNIVSMQEMNPSVIRKYFEYIRNSKAGDKYFYCCNRLEKTLPDGTVIKFRDYPWIPCEIIFDELCPWYQQYPDSIPPFWKSFDGPVQHRMVKL
jgi:hypothetical protein